MRLFLFNYYSVLRKGGGKLKKPDKRKDSGGLKRKKVAIR